MVWFIQHLTSINYNWFKQILYHTFHHMIHSCLDFTNYYYHSLLLFRVLQSLVCWWWWCQCDVTPSLESVLYWTLGHPLTHTTTQHHPRQCPCARPVLLSHCLTLYCGQYQSLHSTSTHSHSLCRAHPMVQWQVLSADCSITQDDFVKVSE